MRILLLFILTLVSLQAANEKTVLKGGWYPWEPYQYMGYEQNRPTLTGLDIILTGKILKNSNFDISYEQISWKQHQAELQSGQKDFAMGAFYTQERSNYAYYSKPYRSETVVLYVKKGFVTKFPFSDADSMLKMFTKSNFRVGVVDGYAYIPKNVDDYIKQNQNNPGIVKSQDVYSNLKNLMDDNVDGVLADRIVAADIVWHQKWQDRLEEHPVLLASEPIYAIFSKASTSESTVKAFNDSLEKFKNSDEYNKLMREYLFPVLLSITVSKSWFFALEIVGTIAFALSGILLARNGSYSLFGAFVLAALPAVGGGVMRDILVGREPIALLRTPVYLLLVIATVLIFAVVDYVAHKLYPNAFARIANSKLGRLVTVYGYEVTDALGLASFTVIGVVVAVEMRCEPLWLWGPLLAVVTAVGGSILRDALRADAHSKNLKGNFYPEIAIVWGLAFSYFLIWQSDKTDYEAIVLGVLLTTLGVFLTRIIGVVLAWQSPCFKSQL